MLIMMILDFHKKNKNHITIVASEKNIDYNTEFVISLKMKLIKILEKPSFDFIINAGLYIIDKQY